MKTERIHIANLKCSGCAVTIKKEMLKIPGVLRAEIDIADDAVGLSYENVDRKVIVTRLRALGYPEATVKNGLLLQLKSYVSCMAGKVNNLK